jgi:hypothetical protein
VVHLQSLSVIGWFIANKTGLLFKFGSRAPLDHFEALAWLEASEICLFLSSSFNRKNVKIFQMVNQLHYKLRH